ncbi:MAG: TolC family outer membrane protein [Gammaproteobacteria bacterium]|jgi:outer membrane protein
MLLSTLSKKLVILLFGLFFINLNYLSAENLLEVYYLAAENDPTVLGARQSQLADAEQLMIARAKFLPNVTFSGSQNYGKSSDTYYNMDHVKYNTNQYNLSITQPIFQVVDWMNYATVKKQTLSSLKKYEDVEQKLFLRVAEQYFAVLAAVDQLETSKSAKQAFFKRLEQATQQFKVGVAAITDISDAQARLDTASAKVISDANALTTTKETLGQIVGKFIDRLSPLKQQIPLVPPSPEQIEPWLEKARKYNIKLQAARLDVEAAREAVRLSSSKHLPTLNLSGNFTNSKPPPAPVQDNNRTREIAVALNVPVFSGGAMVAETQQAIFKSNAALQQLEGVYRDAESSTRVAYNSVLTQISQVDALFQCVKSSKVALKATQAATEVGTRTIVDVLNAQSDLLNTQRDYAKARYDYIVNGLKLKQATGSLNLLDLAQVNDLLEQEVKKETKEEIKEEVKQTASKN